MEGPGGKAAENNWNALNALLEYLSENQHFSGRAQVAQNESICMSQRLVECLELKREPGYSV